MEDRWDKIFDEQFRQAFEKASSEPSWDSWVRIENRLQAQETAKNMWWLRAAASVALLVGVFVSSLSLPEEVALAESEMNGRSNNDRTEVTQVATQLRPESVSLEVANVNVEQNQETVPLVVRDRSDEIQEGTLAPTNTNVITALSEEQPTLTDGFSAMAKSEPAMDGGAEDLKWTNEPVARMKSFEVSGFETFIDPIDVPISGHKVDYLASSIESGWVVGASLGFFGVSEFEWSDETSFAPNVSDQSTIAVRRGAYSSTSIERSLSARVLAERKIGKHWSASIGLTAESMTAVEEATFSVTRQEEQVVEYYGPVIADGNQVSVQAVSQTVINTEQFTDTGSINIQYRSFGVPVMLRYSTDLNSRLMVYGQAGVNININSTLDRELRLPESPEYGSSLVSSSSISESNVSGAVGAGVGYRIGRRAYVHLEPSISWKAKDYQAEHFNTAPNQLSLLGGVSFLL